MNRIYTIKSCIILLILSEFLEAFRIVELVGMVSRECLRGNRWADGF